MNDKKNVIVIGCGSVANKHINNLLKLNFLPFVLLRNKKNINLINKENRKKITIIDNLKNIKSYNFFFSIIANKTNNHHQYINFFIKKKIHIYCEKPLTNNLKKIINIKSKIKKNFNFKVGYQWKETEIIKYLKKLLINEKAIHANLYVGHNVDYWRKSKINNKSYYVYKKQGGGVIFELVHEINLINHLFGKICKIQTFKNKSDRFKCEDLAVSIFKTKDEIYGTLTQEMIGESYSRKIEILTKTKRIEANLINGKISIYKKNLITKKIQLKKIDQKYMLLTSLNNFILEIYKNNFNSKKNFLEAEYDIKTCLKMHKNEN